MLPILICSILLFGLMMVFMGIGVIFKRRGLKTSCCGGKGIDDSGRVVCCSGQDVPERYVQCSISIHRD